MFVYQVCEWTQIDFGYVDLYPLYKNLSDASERCYELYNELYPKLGRMKEINWEVTDGYGVKYKDESYFTNFRFEHVDQNNIVGYGLCDKVNVIFKHSDDGISKTEKIDKNYIVCCIIRMMVKE